LTDEIIDVQESCHVFFVWAYGYHTDHGRKKINFYVISEMGFQ